MKRPTPEEIAAAKADAQARFGRSEVLEVVLSAPIDFYILVAPHDLASYEAQGEQQRQDLESSFRNAVHARRCWPDAATVTELLDRRPAAARKICERLQRRAGKLPGDVAVELLADVIARTSADGEAIPGLPRAKAVEMLEAHRDQELFTAVGPSSALSLVMVRPEGDVFLAARTARTKALTTGKRTISTALDFAKQAILWSAHPIDALLDNLPALSADITDAYEELGGEGAEATSKSL